MQMLMTLLLCFGMLLGMPGSGMAKDLDLDLDLDNGEEINELCAGCHGEFGEGGSQGEYPRLAGQPAGFIANQLYLFQDRKRTNLAMVEYMDERQMPAGDIADISAYLSRIELPTRLPPLDEENFDPLERLLQARRVINIARAQGDAVAGKRLYKRECGSCHGRDGGGRQDKDVPMLAGQFTDYLWRQVKQLLSRQRIHDQDDPEEELLMEFSREQLRDIFAYLSVADD